MEVRDALRGLFAGFPVPAPFNKGDARFTAESVLVSAEGAGDGSPFTSIAEPPEEGNFAKLGSVDAGPNAKRGPLSEVGSRDVVEPAEDPVEDWKGGICTVLEPEKLRSCAHGFGEATDASSFVVDGIEATEGVFAGSATAGTVSGALFDGSGTDSIDIEDILGGMEESTRFRWTGFARSKQPNSVTPEQPRTRRLGRPRDLAIN
jgi:hypothetical protein